MSCIVRKLEFVVPSESRKRSRSDQSSSASNKTFRKAPKQIEVSSPVKAAGSMLPSDRVLDASLLDLGNGMVLDTSNNERFIESVASMKVFRFSPPDFLQFILTSNGYKQKLIPAQPSTSANSAKLATCTEHMLEVYTAIETSNIPMLRQLQRSGIRLDLINRTGDTLLHNACRCATADVVRLILSSGADPLHADSSGRLPIHEACWRTEPDFEILLLLLKHDRFMLLRQDRLRCCPLSYVRKEQWPQWCMFLQEHADELWPEPPRK